MRRKYNISRSFLRIVGGVRDQKKSQIMVKYFIAWINVQVVIVSVWN